MDTLSLADHGPIIPVIVLQRVADAVPVAEALLAGGIKVLEVTLRTSVALACMEEIAHSVPEAILGAGTVRSQSDAKSARDAGCVFAVSPGYTPDLGIACRSLDLPLLPGVATASELMLANANGYNFLKFFPASTAGGVPMLKALAGPFPDVAFCPTGGITPDNAGQYLALPNVRVCGGSWLTPADAMHAGDWSRITRLAREASALRS